MVDKISRKALTNFMEPILDIDPRGWQDDGLLNDKAIKQGLTIIINKRVYSTEQITIKLRQTEDVLIPEPILKTYIETGEWLGGRIG